LFVKYFKYLHSTTGIWTELIHGCHCACDKLQIQTPSILFIQFLIFKLFFSSAKINIYSNF